MNKRQPPPRLNTYHDLAISALIVDPYWKTQNPLWGALLQSLAASTQCKTLGWFRDSTLILSAYTHRRYIKDQRHVGQ